jgi:formate hydrogenlyase transcriptional activator
MIERGVILSRGFVLEIPLKELDQSPVSALHDNNGSSTLESFEREHILNALRETGWVVAGAAARLGLNRSTLNARMRKLQIRRPRPEPVLLTPRSSSRELNQ